MKTKNNYDTFLHIKGVKKILLIMKLTMILIFLTVFQVTATSIFSQGKNVSLDMQNVTVREVIIEIETQGEINFFYNDDLTELNRQISVFFQDKPIKEVLENALAQADMTYEVIKDNFVVLIPNTRNINVQVIRVIGTVTDQDGKPLPGVNITYKGTISGTITDLDGNFSIEVDNPEAVLVFSFVGMVSQEITVGDQTEINIILTMDFAGLEEVVVVGYGTVKKGDLTGSVSQVKTEDLESVPVYNIEEALKSRSAGVSVKQNSGTPGGRIDVIIRGGNSMIGNNQPLYVVDGFPVTGDISFINPSDIESVNILKDASATAIYGSRGANGVVIITSKRGRTGQKSKIEINSFFGVQIGSNRYEMLDAKQYAEVANEWLANSGGVPYFNLDEVQDPGTDWQDFIFRNAPLNNHTITFSGSTAKTKFALSGNFYGMDGIIKYTGVKKGTFRLNLDHEFNKIINLAVNLNLARRENKNLPVDNTLHGGGILSGAMAAPPTLPVYDENGQIVQIAQVYSFGSVAMQNPAVYFPPRRNISLSNTIIGNTNLNINFTDDLSLKTLFGLEYENIFGDNFSPIIFAGDRGSASQSYGFRNSVLIESILAYTKTFNDRHNLNIIGGYTYQTNMYRNFGIGVSGFANNTTENYDLGAAQTIGNPSSGYSEWTLESWLARANYSFDNKYMLTASIRADGSSRFGANNKWGIFPSGAIAWLVSEESFMENINIINFLKIRASYGITGNTALSPYQSLNRLTSVKTIYGNHADEIGFVPDGIANPDLKWESTAQLDFGFDLYLLNNRFSFIFDYYKKNTSDLLASVPLPPSVGFGSSLQNIGEIQNTGLEFSLAVDILRNNFKWDVSTQVSTNRNEVVKLAGGSDIYGGGVGIFGNISLAREGEPLGVFYGYTEDGLNEQGYIKYIDRDGDGANTPLDRSIIGSPYPDFIFGFNSNFSYKNFDLNIFLEGVSGNDIWWATSATHLNSFQRGSNQFADLYGNYWTAENPDPNAKYGKISSDYQIGDSDRFVKDGSYIRLRSLRLAYNIPASKIGMPWIEVAQIYLSGTNLFTITNYPGIDPDVNTTGSDSQNINTRLTTGVDQNGYPLSKIYGVGLKLTF